MLKIKFSPEFHDLNPSRISLFIIQQIHWIWGWEIHKQISNSMVDLPVSVVKRPWEVLHDGLEENSRGWWKHVSWIILECNVCVTVVEGRDSYLNKSDKENHVCLL